jgi:flagellar basal body rod protein FlgC
MAIGPVARSFGFGFDISASGMRDAMLRLDVAANNIANLNTDSFVPSHVQSSERPGGGVTSVVVRDPAPVPDPSGTTPSGTDLPGEIADILTAQIAFAANAFALRAQAATARVLIDLLV